MKHQLKLLVRGGLARLLFHSGLHSVVNRLTPRRHLILFGHCVAEDAVNGGLPADMKIGAKKLEQIVDWFHKRYRVLPIGAAQKELRSGAKGPSLVSLSMDDGYRDNATALLPLLRARGLGASVFLETRPLDERRVNWSHKYFWILDQPGQDAEAVARRYLVLAEDAPALEGLRRALEGGDNLAYQIKRVLKYDAQPEDRERVLDLIFAECGGDEAALCERLYLSWDQAREMRDGGFELGAHTVNHAILSRLSPEAARSEVHDSAASLERELGNRGDVFAYPFGRRWDYEEVGLEAVRAEGFEFAVATHAGVNAADAQPLELKRIPIGDETELHLLVAEACGAFAWLSKLGLRLSE